MSTETTFNGTIADLRTLMSKLENEHRDGYEYHPNAAPLFFYETFKPGDSEPNPNRAAWNVIPNFTGDDKNYHAGIEVYQVGQQVTIEFIDGYCPRYNEIDGRARGQGVFSDEFEPIGDSFWALVELIKQRLPGSVAPMAEDSEGEAGPSKTRKAKIGRPKYDKEQINEKREQVNEVLKLNKEKFVSLKIAAERVMGSYSTFNYWRNRLEINK